ncbi:SDR family oxidoreductase [Halopseudomonas sp.]|jgi:NAD(P)-dependent dehydrogenase (short-subunit alcohol dehydrogenase family)|uniref:SDR family oxidoreductase n=1 Tax=Halopseudomonas sp. TaxID=2901191 RepID=UPI001A4531AC|nr:SDR family oxidoreductase [Pseudomonas sp.]|tara:strand:- start:1147 stop:2004 length:858 start_codon:yes stop_codon:yes gene_type:complete
MSEEKTPPAQHQDQQPGSEKKMDPPPVFIHDHYRSAGKLKDKVAIVTGGDSGIGRAVAVHFAAEGAKVLISYLDEHDDARTACEEIEKRGGEVISHAGDIGEREVCQELIDTVLARWGRLDVLVNNAGEQHVCDGLEEIEQEQWERTFRTNVFSMFQLTKAALPHLGEGAAIVNSTSITAYQGNPKLIDYSSTKGAITAFTRSLSISLAKRGIRVNGVAPGPTWTPLIPSTFDADSVAEFGASTPMERPGEPADLAPGYVYLACDDSSFVSGQVLHINGGKIVNG